MNRLSLQVPAALSRHNCTMRRPTAGTSAAGRAAAFALRAAAVALVTAAAALLLSCASTGAVPAAMAGGVEQPRAAEEETETVSLRWALAARESDADTPSAIQRDTQLQGGDRLKFLVEPLSTGSVYLILLDAAEQIHVLYRSPAAEGDAGPSYIPPGRQWFEVDEAEGLETFFLLASIEPLAALEGLLDRYTAADDGSRGDVSREIVSEIRRLHKQHRNFARPIEKPMMIGGQTRGTEDGAAIDRLALEVSAERFYAKTITIEH